MWRQRNVLCPKTTTTHEIHNVNFNIRIESKVWSVRKTSSQGTLWRSYNGNSINSRFHAVLSTHIPKILVLNWINERFMFEMHRNTTKFGHCYGVVFMRKSFYRTTITWKGTSFKYILWSYIRNKMKWQRIRRSASWFVLVPFLERTQHSVFCPHGVFAQKPHIRSEWLLYHSISNA